MASSKSKDGEEDDISKYRHVHARSVFPPSLHSMFFSNGQGKLWKADEAAFKSALEARVKNGVYGGDTGVFSRREQARDKVHGVIRFRLEEGGTVKCTTLVG